MSRRSPSGKHILPPTTFKMPAMAAQPCRILKHPPDLLKDLQAQEGRGVGNHQSADRAATSLQGGRINQLTTYTTTYTHLGRFSRLYPNWRLSSCPKCKRPPNTRNQEIESKRHASAGANNLAGVTAAGPCHPLSTRESQIEEGRGACKILS
jgi:hypothetical protein